MGISTAAVLERLATSQKHTRIPNLGLVRFPTHKNSHMLPVNKTWALPSLLPVYNTSSQGCQQNQQLSVLQKQPLPRQVENLHRKNNRGKEELSPSCCLFFNCLLKKKYISNPISTVEKQHTKPCGVLSPECRTESPISMTLFQCLLQTERYHIWELHVFHAGERKIFGQGHQKEGCVSTRTTGNAHTLHQLGTNM